MSDDIEETTVVVGTGAGGEGDPAPAEATPGVTRSTDYPEAPAQAHHHGPPCVMTHTPPFDFAVCETHDTTFALGETCKFDGRDPADVYAEEVDEQRARAVVAEMRLAEHEEAVLVANERAAAIMAQHTYNRHQYECLCTADVDNAPTIDETEWAHHILLVLASEGLVHPPAPRSALGNELRAEAAAGHHSGGMSTKSARRLNALAAQADILGQKLEAWQATVQMQVEHGLGRDRRIDALTQELDQARAELAATNKEETR